MKMIVAYIQKFPIIILLAALLLFSAGCALSSSNLKTRDIRLVTDQHKQFSFIQVDGHEEGGHFIIKGKLKSKSYKRGATFGHVDIAVIDSNNAVISKTSSYLSRASRKTTSSSKRTKVYAFSAQLNPPPPNGSTIRLALHEPDLKPVRMFDCGANSAAIEVQKKL